jgi:hypothetical protein
VKNAQLHEVVSLLAAENKNTARLAFPVLNLSENGFAILSLEKAVDKELLTLFAIVLDVVKNRIQFEQDAKKEGSVE